MKLGDASWLRSPQKMFFIHQSVVYLLKESQRNDFALVINQKAYSHIAAINPVTIHNRLSGSIGIKK
jgi:hypothetical protein